MIRSKAVLRRGALALAVAFQATAAVDMFGLDTCPHHSLLPVAAANGGTKAGDGESGPARHAHDAAAHGHHHGEAAAAPGHEGLHASVGEAPNPHEGHGPDGGPCTCVGTCEAGPGPVVTLAARPTFALEPVLSDAAATTFRADEALPSPPPFLLPFSQAPPSIA